MLVLSLVLGGPYAQARAPDDKIIHAFAGGRDGSGPADGVTMDSAGSLYGTTTGGGHAGCSRSGGCGTVFEIAQDGTESILLAFDRADGSLPESVPFIDKAGNIYATTIEGGDGRRLGHGTLVRIPPDGQATVLHYFCRTNACRDGGSPSGRLIGDKAGNLFGVAYVGGPEEDGVIFEYTSGGKYKIIYAIGEPEASGEFARDADGNFYVATGGGGANGTGTIIKVSPDGTGTILYDFGANGSGDEASPTGVTLDNGGALYGFTYAGGANGAGTVFTIDSNGSEQVLYSFTGGNGGASPSAAPLLDKAGNICGVASAGGTNNSGAVFELTSAGKLNVLHDFANSPDGAEPFGSLFMTKGGVLYGTTFYGGSEKGVACRTTGCGTVFTLEK
jgi:uncharacterized repeat protein (TIGR03803 family)